MCHRRRGLFPFLEILRAAIQLVALVLDVFRDATMITHRSVFLITWRLRVWFFTKKAIWDVFDPHLVVFHEEPKRTLFELRAEDPCREFSLWWLRNCHSVPLENVRHIPDENDQEKAWPLHKYTDVVSDDLITRPKEFSDEWNKLWLFAILGGAQEAVTRSPFFCWNLWCRSFQIQQNENIAHWHQFLLTENWGSKMRWCCCCTAMRATCR